MEHLFNEYFIKKVKTTSPVVFHPEKVRIIQLSEATVLCNYTSDNVYIHYAGDHSVTFPSKAHVSLMFVDYSPSGLSSGIAARLFSFSHDANS